MYFKNQPGPVVKNATVGPTDWNRTRHPANICSVLRQLSCEGRQHAYTFCLYRGGDLFVEVATLE